jgi:hypothetical protein
MVYYPLYMLIMKVDHDFGRMRDFGRMPDFDQKIGLRSPFPTPVDITTSDVSPNSDHAS